MLKRKSFDRCKKDDKLWSIQLGECWVLSKSPTQILVTTRDGNPPLSYYFDGKKSTIDAHPSLYFSDPNIIPPPAPIQIVKKTYTLGYKAVPTSEGSTIHLTNYAYTEASKISDAWNKVSITIDVEV